MCNTHLHYFTTLIFRQDAARGGGTTSAERQKWLWKLERKSLDGCTVESFAFRRG
ncbi:MAG: hypothetical protein ACMVP2_19750 [Imperialibacter sp.]|uniref:hypothetical protein n=1 Tax=Imperialibacter sp. TaxID=2038411 RepID=UPI003A8A5EB9